MYICYLFIILLYLFEIVDEVLYYELFMYLFFLTCSTSRGTACQKRSMEQIKYDMINGVWQVYREESQIMRSPTLKYTNTIPPPFYLALLQFDKMAVTFTIFCETSLVVKALCYKTESRGFETRWDDFFQFT
jgi:hypothetical protein